MTFAALTGGSWLRKTMAGALVSVAIGLGAYAFSAVDNRYVKSDRYERDRISDSLRQEQRLERADFKDSVLNAKMDEALLRLQQIQCGDKIVRGCR